MANAEIQELRTFLPVKDWLIVGAEAGVATAAVLAAQHLGLTETYFNLLASAAHANILADYIQEAAKGVLGNPEKLKPALMFAGFFTAVVTDLVYAADVLVHLNGKIRLQGNNDFTIKNGVRVRDRDCVDSRIIKQKKLSAETGLLQSYNTTDQLIQEKVEPGAGQMGGAFIMNNMAAILVDKLGDGPASDFLAGYLVGRTLPTVVISAMFTLGGAVESWFGGPVNENQLPHNHACGWTGTENTVKHWLKFSHNHHEQKAAILDAWNRVDETANTLIWEPLMNIPAFAISFGRYRISHSFGRTPIN